MASIPDILAAATAHHGAGRLAEAEKAYREILRREPRHPEAWHFLGLLASQIGKQDVASDYLQRAIRLRPGEPTFHRNLGVIYEATKEYGRAILCYRRVLELEPNSAEAHYCLANGLKAAGENGEAIPYYRKAINLNPGFAEAHNNLGSALKRMGRSEEATASFRRAIEANPGYAEAYVNFGSTLRQLGDAEKALEAVTRALELKPELPEALATKGEILRFLGRMEEARACFQKALEMNPRYVGAHRGLGGILRHGGRLDEAADAYRRALKFDPRSAPTHNDLGIVLQQQGHLEEAASCFRRASELAPDFAESYINWGAVLQMQERPEEAVAQYRKALDLSGEFTEAHLNLGNVLQASGRLDEAELSYRKAVRCDPKSVPALSQLVHQLKQLCRWDDVRELSDRLFAEFESGGGNMPPFSLLNLPSSPAQQLRCAREHANRVAKFTRHGSGRFDRPPSRPHRSEKIRLGYVSVDFREHAISYLVAELIERHDRDRFEVIGYSYGPDDGSPTRRRIAEAFDQFVDVRGLSPAAAARRILEDGIDIAIDLTGYLPRSREEILAHRPAPVQVSFLGFAATMGADWIDYIVADHFVVPPEHEGSFSENIVRLPGCYLVSDSKREVSPDTPSREECGLPADGMVFCSLNQTHKITPEIFQVWMKFLSRSEDSVLWLWESNPFAPENLRKEATVSGIDPSRLIFAPNLPQAEHLARYRVADLALDTFPYNGHTTTGDALWMGCPVLTLAGQTFSSRVAGSALNAGGLPELVTQTPDEYERLGCELVRRPERLAEYRRRLEANREVSPLFDTGTFAKNLEKAFAEMWERHLAGEPARPFNVVGEPS